MAITRAFTTLGLFGLLTSACALTSDTPDDSGTDAGEPEPIGRTTAALTPAGVFGRLSPSAGSLIARDAPVDGTWLGGWHLGADNDVLPFAGDFDGDGQDDIVIRSGWGIGVLTRTTSGSWTQLAEAPYGTLIGSLTLRNDDRLVGVGRFAGDTRASLVIQGLNGLALVQCNAGVFQSRAYFPYGTRIGGWLLGHEDKIRGTGHTTSGDAFFITSAWGMGVLRVDAGSTGAALAMVPTGTTFGHWTLDASDPALRFVAIADVDGDGVTEAIVQSAAGIGILGISGSFVHRASFGPRESIASVARPLDWLATVADLNRDGRADFLFQTSSGIRVVGADATWAFHSIASHDYGTWISGSWNFGSNDKLRSLAGDFDGDGQNDFVLESGWGIGMLSVSGTDIRVVGMRYRPDLPVSGDYYFSNEQTLLTSAHLDRTAIARDLLFHTPYVPTAFTTRAAVLTQHNDSARTGQFLQETWLTPGLVAARGMSKCARPTDAPLTTQALYAPDLTIAGAAHDVVYAATTNNTIYAFDANNMSRCGTSAGQLWSTHLVDPVSTSARPAVWMGIGGTPVIDLARKTMYVVYATSVHPWATEDEDPSTDAHYWLTALNLETGAVIRSVNITASYARSDGSLVHFNAGDQNHRAALLLDHGSIYVAFAMRHREEAIEYHGWVLRYDALTFDQLGAFSTTPNQIGGVHRASAGQGAGIWQGGGGLVADEQGNIYFETGNAVADPGSLSYGNQFMKMQPMGRTLQLVNNLDGSGFTSIAANSVHGASTAMHLMDVNDVDLGAGGPTFIPGTNQLFGGGKPGALSLINRDTFGRVEEFYAAYDTFDTSAPATAIANRYNGWDGSPHLHGSSTFWRGADPSYGLIYTWGERDALRIFHYNFVGDGNTARIVQTPTVGSLVVPATDVGGGDVMPGGMMSISSNGATHTGIVWAIVPTAAAPLPNSAGHPAELIALDAESAAILWRGPIPANPHWACPTVAAGKVFVTTGINEVDLFSLRPLLIPPFHLASPLPTVLAP